MLPSGDLFPSYGTELIPLLPYLRAGLSQKKGDKAEETKPKGEMS